MSSADPFSSQRREADDFLDGGSKMIAAKFPSVGSRVRGTITSWEAQVQQTDMETGELMYFQNKKKVKESEVKGDVSRARPAMEMRIDLQCEATGITWKTNQYIEEEVPDDDGMRRLYVSGNLQKAIGKAKKEAGENGASAPLEVGVLLDIVRLKSVKSGDFFAYAYEATWTPARLNPDAGKFLDDEADPFAQESEAEPAF